MAREVRIRRVRVGGGEDVREADRVQVDLDAAVSTRRDLEVGRAGQEVSCGGAQAAVAGGYPTRRDAASSRFVDWVQGRSRRGPYPSAKVACSKATAQRCGATGPVRRDSDLV
jgi:hypothetical protein